MKLTPEAEMNRTTLALLGAVALLGTACAEPEPSLLIDGHVPLVGGEAMTEEGEEGDGEAVDCSAPGSIDDVEFSAGSLTINLAEKDFFQLGLMMENRLVDSSSYSPSGFDQNQRLNQNHIEVQTISVTFDSDRGGFNALGDGGELLYERTGLVTTNQAKHVSLPLFRPFEVNEWREAFAVASGGQGDAIVPTFVEVQVRGETIGGSRVRSNILTIPVEICDGCNLASTPICTAGG